MSGHQLTVALYLPIRSPTAKYSIRQRVAVPQAHEERWVSRWVAGFRVFEWNRTWRYTVNHRASQVLTSFACGDRDPSMVKSSRAMQEVCDLAERVATSDAKVLIAGESGTGKGMLAQYIHARSARARRPFVAANCAVFHEAFMASEPFGHSNGRVTGDERNTWGMLAHAHLGTLFLDEVSDMSLRMQARLLRFLESGDIPTVGANRSMTKVNVRVISATNRDLTERTDQGGFRRDLLYRLNVIPIVVPPLRDRREDIRPLIERAVGLTGRRIRLTHNAQAAMERYRWPGNVRELHNVVERLALMARSDVIDRSDLPSFLFDSDGSLPPISTAALSAARSSVTSLAGWQGAA
jgi:DNA-binding NtrC family response regulator